MDNSDLKIDTPNGKNQLQGTVIAIYQQQDKEHIPNPLDFERSKSLDNKSYPQLYPQRYCPEPVRENKVYAPYQPTLDESFHKLKDTTYFFLKAMNISKDNLRTWSAFNSLSGNEKPITTFCSLPLIQSTPTDWSNLFQMYLFDINFKHYRFYSVIG